MNNIQRQFPIYWWTPDDLDRKGKDDIERAPTEKGDTAGRSSTETDVAGAGGRIVIDGERIVVPDWLPLEYEEIEMLEILRTKLRKGQRLDNSRSRESDRTQMA